MMWSVLSRGTRFDWFAAYLVRPERDTGQERVAWTAVRNLPSEDPALAAAFMSATAAMSIRSQRPVYTVVVSFAPEDPVDRAVMERVADRVLERLGLAEHQALFVAHRDRPHPHFHIVVNLVHPETGRVHSLWQDWRRTREVLAEEEQALGLRPTHATRTDDLARDLRTYERVVELTGEHYRAQLAASAATARKEQLELAGDRARTILNRCHQALAAVYRDPTDAYHAYLAAVDEHGVSRATQRMFERPEHFGALVTVQRSRAFGLLPGADETAARFGAPAAAAAAREAVVAVGVWRKATESLVRAVDQAFERDLAAIYREPTAARAAFDRLAQEHGIERAAAAIRARSASLGPVLTPAPQDRDGLGEQAAEAAARGVAAVQARAAAQGPMPPSPPDVTLALSRSEADAATSWERRVRTELHALPKQAELERRLSVAVEHLQSWNLRFLRGIITAPQWAILAQFRKKLRDIALGRGDERDQSP
jgi:Relaxase/Mobilisation nuclease domain